ncbi:glycoside hydrolase family 2 protein [Paraflavitalea devenefica]|uniref:glycoside hydrolase family 2 protein n=1 Tax=Paraflavitalea devenefica TaxID=2716334 RepID=UPI001ABB9E49|nr:sugar-binding domain-containing protein [Paraflavitalea devenefica]
MSQMKNGWTALCLLAAIGANAQTWKMQPVALHTRWAKEVKAGKPHNEYPRPQMERQQWTNLNGLWEYAVQPADAATPTNWQGHILVPFPLESALSGVKKVLLPEQRLWYRRSFDKPILKAGEKLLLHFGAVDYQCWVYLNGKEIGTHEGGYTAFNFDITATLKEGANELVLKVYDPSDAGIGPCGKQVLKPQSIYYTPSSGIWQTVWLEQVPTAYIASLQLTPQLSGTTLEKGSLSISSQIKGECKGCILEVSIPQTNTAATLRQGQSGQYTGALNFNQPQLWSPATPYLHDLVIRLKKGGKVIDEVKSYVGMRQVSVEKDKEGTERIFLNGKPYFNLGTLDQGFWPDGLHTAPTDAALRFDIEAIKAMGFNTIRKHIKIEPARWYYHADKLGILVWQDFVQPNPRLPEGAKKIFEQQGKEMMEQLRNHPAITTWVLFNEKWGQYDQERLTKWVKATDPSRLVNGHSGEILYVNEKLRSPSPNAYVAADMTDVHSYPDPMISISMPGKARVLGEFGGIGVFIPNHQWNSSSAWGYINEKPAGLKAKYSIMTKHLQLLQKEGLSASIYTQPYDVEGEQNGLMTYDRGVIKIPLKELRKIHQPLNPQIGSLPEVTIADADLTEPGEAYAAMLDQYMNGKTDPAFLKELALAAAQTGDRAGVNRFNIAFFASLKTPYSPEDQEYIEGSTKKVTDPGFGILQQQLQSNPNRPLHTKLMNIIYQDVIAPYVPNPQVKPNWNEIAEKVKPYGAPGDEIFLRAKSIHLLNQKDWENLKPVAKEYLDKYGQYVKPEEKKMLEDKI